jgi:hypothetical protein
MLALHVTGGTGSVSSARDGRRRASDSANVCQQGRSVDLDPIDARATPPGAAELFKAIAAAPNISTAPRPSAQPNRSDSATTPTATAITGLTKA